jgi:hypothetical protein
MSETKHKTFFEKRWREEKRKPNLDEMLLS